MLRRIGIFLVVTTATQLSRRHSLVLARELYFSRTLSRRHCNRPKHEKESKHEIRVTYITTVPGIKLFKSKQNKRRQKNTLHRQVK